MPSVRVCYLQIDDIQSTLQSLNLIQYWKGQHIVSCSAKQLEAYLEQYKVKPGFAEQLFDPSKLVWTPPVKPTAHATHKGRR